MQVDRASTRRVIARRGGESGAWRKYITENQGFFGYWYFLNQFGEWEWREVV